MRLVTVFRLSLMIFMAAIAVPVRAQTTPETTSTATVSQPLDNGKSNHSENTSASAPTVDAQTPENSKTEAPVRFRIPLSSRIFPATSMEQ